MRLSLTFMASVLAMSSALAQEIHFTEQKTPAGVTFWYRNNSDSTKSSVMLGWPDGYGLQKPGKEALFHVAAELLLRGAGDRNGNEIEEDFNDLQARGGLFSNPSETFMFLTAPADKIQPAAELAATILTDPKLPQKELDRLRETYKSNLKQYLVQPTGQGSYVAEKLLYGDTAVSRSIEVGAVDGITTQDIDAWRKAVLTKQRMIIAASSTLSADDFGKAIDALTSKLPQNSDLQPILLPVATITAKTIILERESPQTFIFEFRSADVHPDRMKLQASIAVGVLGGGIDSRLSSAIRQKIGASYDTNIASIEGYRSGEHLALKVAVGNDKAQEVLTVLDSEYERWLNDGINEQELDAARGKFRAANNYSRPGADVGTFVSAMLFGRPPNDPFDYEQRLKSYTAASTNADIKARFTKTPVLRVIVTPQADQFHADCIIKDISELGKCQ